MIINSMNSIISSKSTWCGWLPSRLCQRPFSS